MSTSYAVDLLDAVLHGRLPCYLVDAYRKMIADILAHGPRRVLVLVYVGKPHGADHLPAFCLTVGKAVGHGVGHLDAGVVVVRESGVVELLRKNKDAAFVFLRPCPDPYMDH